MEKIRVYKTTYREFFIEPDGKRSPGPVGDIYTLAPVEGHEETLPSWSDDRIRVCASTDPADCRDCVEPNDYTLGDSGKKLYTSPGGDILGLWELYHHHESRPAV